MSEQIDWSKAPEGASHYVIGWGFFKLDLAGWFICDDGEKVWRKTPYQSPDNFSWWGNAVARPSTPSWSGEGLPPVGVVCEFKSPSSGGWLKARIIFVSAWTVVLYVFFEHDEHCYSVSAFEKGNLQFRPIRTPEQIAADERDKAAHELFRTAWPETHSWGDLSPHWQEAFYRLADAGYRKP